MVKHRMSRRGASLVEALIALLVMAIGMLAMSNLQARLRQSGDLARQRAEATRIAVAEMERLRAFAALRRHAGLPAAAIAFDEIGEEAWTVAAGSTVFQLRRDVQPLAQAGVELLLRVAWNDRASEDGELMLNWRSALAAADPRLALAAFLPPDAGAAQGRLHQRHPSIPSAALDLDGQHSLLRPLEQNAWVLLLEHRRGRILGSCDIAPERALGSLSPAELRACGLQSSPPIASASGAFLLSGHVRFSLDEVADSAAPNDPVLPLDIELLLNSSGHAGAPRCELDRHRAAPAGVQALDYVCMIPPRTDAKGSLPDWSGSIRFGGLSFGPGGYRVCRYGGVGNDGIGSTEHRGQYEQRTGSLSQQNFLVVRHESACPAGQRVDVAAQVFRNTATVQHQP